MPEPGFVRVPREASGQDVDELVRLRSLLLSSGEKSYSARTEAEERTWRSAYRWWLTERAFSSDAIHVAVIPSAKEGVLAACAIGVIDDRAPTHAHANGKVGWVQTVVVDPEHRSLGFGKAVIHHLFDWFRAHEVREITLQTTPAAQRLYRRLGFRPTGEDTLVRSF